MHTVDLLDHALAAAAALGIRVRQEWLGGGGGGCEIKGQPWIFLDLAQSPLDQLHQVVDVLRRTPAAVRLELPDELRSLLDIRKSA